MPSSFKLSGTVKLTATWTEAEDLSDVVETSVIAPAVALANGSGDGQANATWQSAVTVNAGQTVSHNLKALPQSVFGSSGTLSLSTVKLLFIQNTGNAPLAVGGWTSLAAAGSNAASIPIPAKASILLFAPNAALQTGTEASLQITNTGTAAGAYSIIVVGVS